MNIDIKQNAKFSHDRLKASPAIFLRDWHFRTLFIYYPDGTTDRLRLDSEKYGWVRSKNKTSVSKMLSLCEFIGWV